MQNGSWHDGAPPPVDAMTTLPLDRFASLVRGVVPTFAPGGSRYCCASRVSLGRDSLPSNITQGPAVGGRQGRLVGGQVPLEYRGLYFYQSCRHGIESGNSPHLSSPPRRPLQVGVSRPVPDTCTAQTARELRRTRPARGLSCCHTLQTPVRRVLQVCWRLTILTAKRSDGLLLWMGLASGGIVLMF